MKCKKYVVPLILSSALVMSVTAGCGKSQTPAASSQQQTQQPAQTQNGQQEKSSEAPAEKVKIKMISSTEFEVHEFANLEETFAKFSDIAPNVEIEGEYIPWTELDNKLFLTNAGGDYYDVILVNNSTLPALVEAGILADMTEFTQKDNFDVDQVFTPAMADLCKYKDGIYAFPFQTDTRILAVNTKMLDEAGMELPRTKEDMLKIAEAVTRDTNGDGTPDQFGYSMNISRTLPCVYIQGNWLIANGLHLYEVEDDGQYVCRLNSEAGIDFFKWASEMAKYMPNDMISYDNAMIDNAFASGKFAMYTYGAWMTTREDFIKTVEETGTEYQLILNPEGLEGTASTSGGWMLGVSPKSQNKEAAWEFIKFIVNPEVNASICSGLPPVQDAYNYPPFNTEEYGILKEQLQTSQTAVKNFIPEFNELVDIYGNNFIASVLGEKSPEQAAKEAEDGVNALLKEKGYQK